MSDDTDLTEAREALRAAVEQLRVALLVLWDGIRDAVKRLIRCFYRAGLPAAAFPGQWRDTLTGERHPWPPPALSQ